MNIKVRMKNVWFWFGLIGVILTAMGVSAETLTSWSVLGQHLYELICNPYMIVSVIMAVIGQFVDPTTKGIKDSTRAMSYDKPSDS